MATEVILERILNHPSLPSPPSLALRVLEKASRPDCTIAEISSLINRDPALAAQLLKLVNSALYAIPRAVTSINRALSLLGLKRVRSLVLALSLPALQRGKAPDVRLKAYWKAWVASSMVARELAVRLKRPDPESDLMASLLCDLGILILSEVYPAEYAAILDQPIQARLHNQCEIEVEALGIAHPEISAAILRAWNFPAEITEPIRFHHQPAHAYWTEPELQQRGSLLHFAGRVGQLELAPEDPLLCQEVLTFAASRFDMDGPQLQAFLESLQDKVAEFGTLLHIDMGPRQQYAALTAHATEQLTQLAVETSLELSRVHQEKSQVEQAHREVEAALRKSEEQLRQAQKMEAIGRLAGGVAHDFNNLLTIITGYSEVLLSRLPPGDRLREPLQQIKTAGDRAASLTAQLLAFSRKQVLKPVILDVNGIVRNLEKMIKRLIGEDMELVPMLAPDLHTVKADPGQLEQVLLNLVVNSRDAMPQGGRITVETANVSGPGSAVELSAEVRLSPHVLLAVSDTGCGMDAETRAHIFEPFFTTKEQGKGTGLGLATVYGIVKQSGGRIAVHSEPGQGATFKIYLPAVTESVVASSTPTPAAPQDVNGTETILVAEDEAMIRNMVRAALEPRGYVVLEAADGEQALAVARSHPAPVDLLLTDMIMPLMSGAELARRLTRIYPRLKVLFMSGYPDETIVRQGVLLADTPFLQKPFAPPLLTRTIREVLVPRKR